MAGGPTGNGRQANPLPLLFYHIIMERCQQPTYSLAQASGHENDNTNRVDSNNAWETQLVHSIAAATRNNTQSPAESGHGNQVK